MMKVVSLLVAFTAVSVSAQSKSDISVFSESLCPYCRQIVPDLAKFVKEDGILSITNFDFVPYGNARNHSGSITCQHGPDECYGNKVEACVKSIVNNQPLKYMPFIDCLEAQDSHMKQSDVERCANKNNLPVSTINECVQGPKGTSLINVEGKKTERANIPGTPTIHCNGKQVEDINAARRCACKHWQGSKPPACERVEKKCSKNW